MWYLYSWTSVRWPSDQPLDSPYSVSFSSIKPVRMRITTIINWKIIVLMYQQILRTQMSREVKDSEGELTVKTQY